MKWADMRVRGTGFVFLDRGAYGAIFVDRANQRIRKVYHTQHEFDHSYEVFAAETGAYKIAANAPDVQTLVPRYFDVCTGQVIVDSTDQDLTARLFHPELAFETAFIDCEFRKLDVEPRLERFPFALNRQGFPNRH